MGRTGPCCSGPGAFMPAGRDLGFTACTDHGCRPIEPFRFRCVECGEIRTGYGSEAQVIVGHPAICLGCRAERSRRVREDLVMGKDD